jgi:hypothetical protein
MKTKTDYKFEVDDFPGSGQMIIRRSSEELEPEFSHSDKTISFALSVAYKIGYCSKTRQACLISIADGLVLLYDDKEALCKKLNEDEVGFRPMTTFEIITCMEYQGNRFKK